MKIQLPKGRYVVAVSGGVDSVVLLDALSKLPNLELVVAHLDHGIREDSIEDRRFVASLAASYGLVFEYGEGRLGSGASEATAREARYNFLRGVKMKHDAKAIITAHHQDDLIETAILNMLRGTGRKGLTSLSSREDILRPLLAFSKQELIEYAKANNLKWHEDSTNQDMKYLRNYIRYNLISKLTDDQRQKMIEVIKAQRSVNAQLDALLSPQVESRELPRPWFVSLPHEIAREVMAAWFRANGLQEFDKQAIERAVIGAKTALPGRQVAIKKGITIEISKASLALKHPER
jgi:tRNA(Ile)-lysidine synthetase-like protein